MAFLYLLMMPSPAMPAPSRMSVEGSGVGVGVFWFMTMLSMDGQNPLDGSGTPGAKNLRVETLAVLTLTVSQLVQALYGRRSTVALHRRLLSES